MAISADRRSLAGWLVGRLRVLAELGGRQNEGRGFVGFDFAQAVDDLTRQPDLLWSGAEEAPALGELQLIKVGGGHGELLLVDAHQGLRRLRWPATC